MKRFILLFLSVLVTSLAYSQASGIKRALKLLEKQEYARVESSLWKIEQKDSLYSGLFFAKAKLYFAGSFGRFNIDSAHYFRIKGEQFLGILEDKERKKLIKLGAGSLDFENLKYSIDSAAYVRAKATDTEKQYIYFLSAFSPTKYDAEIESQRNARAFEQAVGINTYQAYRVFMDKYPEATEFSDARDRYERLYYEKSTADGKLASFKKFLKAHESTPYRKEVEQQIFNIITADYRAISYARFKSGYPLSHLARQAEQFEYHLAKEENVVFKSIFFRDSLNQLSKLPSKLLLYLEGQKYGLMNLKGDAVSPAIYVDPEPTYLCDGIAGDVFLSDRILYSTSGVRLMSKVLSITDLGLGLVAVQQAGGIRVVHKSGKLIHREFFEDVRFIGRQFLAYKKNGRWGLRTLSGITIVKPVCQDIFELGSFILFKQNEEFDIKISRQIVYASDNNPLKLQYLFDDFELLENGSIWLNSSYGQVVFDPELNEQIPYKKQEIDFLPFGYSVSSTSGYQLLNDSFQKVNSKPYSSFVTNSNYIVVGTDSTTKLLRTNNYVELAEMDNIELFGSKFAVGFNTDSLIVYGNYASSVVIPFDTQPKLVSTTDSKEFLKIANEETSWIIDEDGNSFLLNGFDDFSSLDKFLITIKDGKRGVRYKNQLNLEAEYDAIGLQSEGLTLLQGGKFGLYHKVLNLLIEPNYNKRLKQYGETLFVGFSENEHIFLDSNGDKLASLAEVEAIEYWQDSVALIKNSEGWKFFNIYEDIFMKESIRSFTTIVDGDSEKIIMALGEDGYGVLSNVSGEIISMTFNDIVLVGPPDNPIYFTEKHITEAEFYVVIYYDNEGTVLRTQAFDSSDYDLIYCNK